MKTIVVAGAMLAGSVFAAVPVIDPASISARQDGGHTVVIGYTMNPATDGDTDPAIITVDVLTNYTENAEVKWASIGGEHLTTLSGDVNKIVGHTADYKHNILWDPTKEGLPKLKFDANEVKVEITAWATNSPPAYWIIDLTHPADRSYDRYYPNAGQIPLGVTNILYKTDRLVMRRIPAKGVTWRQGNPSAPANNADTCRYVTLSYDYYMAIYEVTSCQNNHLEPWHTSNPNTGVPVVFNLTSWRGDPSSGSYAWPDKGHGAVDLIMAQYRGKLGGLKVDLPTSAEWEFACRAGSSTKYCNGDTESDLNKVAWTYANSGGTMKEVGTKEPNAWGMYDMHGNAFEWTLTRWATRTSDPEWDPVGPKSSEVSTTSGSAPPYAWSKNVWRIMGGWSGNATYGVASYCTSYGVKEVSPSEITGACRLVIPL